MPQTFTLDTNCLIDVADKRPAAKAVQALAYAHASQARPTLLWLQSLRLKNSKTGITSMILQNLLTV
jgi:hypothetical protein